jgi:hypothetical protein
MKSANILKIWLSLLPILFLSTNVLANELDSTNFKMIGVSTSGGGGLMDSTNFKLISTAGQISADPRNYSTNYRINQDPSAIFTAAQPGVECFETDTDGTTDCTSGPAELLSGGMVAICGPGGCYDKARFEIQPYVNPEDTLYMVHISEDNFSSDIKCIDGSTFRPKDLPSCDINDFRTEEYWEDEDFNIKGLQPSTQYYIRISALHGDFTQSDFSTVADATTTAGLLYFDIDIATESGYDTESASPYSISFSGSEQLVAGAAATTASSLVWLDVVSSSAGGVAIIQFGKYGGLYSPTTTETILSDSENLDDSGAEGFGLQSYYIDYESSGYLGEITSTTNYSGSGNVVGAVSTTANKIYDGDGPINDGRMGMYLKARAGVGRTAETDYTEEIYFILVPRY